MKTIMKKVLFLVIAFMPLASFSQQSKQKIFDAKDVYWVAVEESLVEDKKIKNCDDLLKASDRLILTFSRLDSNGYAYTLRLPQKSKAWENTALENFKKMHGQSGVNQLKKSSLSDGKLSMTFVDPAGTQQTIDYVLQKSGNGRYMVKATPGNDALNNSIEAHKKQGKPGMFEMRCEGPIATNTPTAAKNSEANAITQIKSTVLFACQDGYSTGRDWSVAEVLIQTLVDDCTQCYGSLLTNPNISSICSDSGVPMNNKSMAKWQQVGKRGAITYYLYKSSENATMGIMSR